MVSPLLTVERQEDPTHLGQSQLRRGLKASFSPDVFGLESTMTAEEKKQRHKLFALDIKSRCHLVFQHLFENFNGDVKAITRKLPSCVSAMIQCYEGDHNKCARKHICCRGGKSQNWFFQSYYLKHSGMAKLEFTDHDKAIIRDIIDLKLSVEGVNAMKLRTSTNKNESAHRSVSVSLPKNVNFSRNFQSRVHSTAHRLNLGQGESLLTKLEYVNAQPSKGGAVAKSISSIQRASRYHREYKSRPSVKERKKKSKDRQIKEYLKVKLFDKNKMHTYSKAQLHRKPNKNLPKRSKAPHKDHEYSMKPLSDLCDT